MGVLFGHSPDAEGWVKTYSIQYKIDSHENGYSINTDDIPDYPRSKFGVGWEQYYHPGKDEWKFEQVEIPYTKEESMLEIAKAIRELAQAIKEK